MKAPKECAKCGCDRTLLVDSSKIRQQNMDKAGPHSKNKCLYFTIVTLERLCVPCFLKAINFPIKWEQIPSMYKDCVNEED